MTEDDKQLVSDLRLHTDANGFDRSQMMADAADRIESLSAENALLIGECELLRDSLDVARGAMETARQAIQQQKVVAGMDEAIKLARDAAFRGIGS